MKGCNKPVVKESDIKVEGIYASNGSGEKVKCVPNKQKSTNQVNHYAIHALLMTMD